MENIKLICIVGPTGVGKTALSLKLAKHYNGEIVNADAFAVYKYLNIGTAKPTNEELKDVRHHLVSFLNPDEEFNVMLFQKYARQKISDIHRRGKLAIVVGGSGFYLKALLYNYEFGEEETKDFTNYSNEQLKAMLNEKNPVKAAKIHVNNRKRLERALSIKKEKQVDRLLYDPLIIGLTTKREVLYERINARVEKMFTLGLEKEVASLLKKGYGFSLNSMQAIGYKEFSAYYKGEIDLETLKNVIKRNSRRYAKKQYTWFNNQMNVEWYEFENIKFIDKIVKRYVNDCENLHY